MKYYYVYVIELDPVVADFRKFRAKNPKYIKGNSCVYVGQSSRKPELRFEQHKEGYKSNKYAKRFGVKLSQIFLKNITQFQPEKTQKKLKQCWEKI